MASSSLARLPLPADLIEFEPQCILHYGTGLLANVQGSTPSPLRRVQIWDDPFNQGNHWRIQRLAGSPPRVILQADLEPSLALGIRQYDSSGAFYTNYGREAALVECDDPSAIWEVYPPQGQHGAQLQDAGWCALKSTVVVVPVSKGSPISVASPCCPLHFSFQ